MKAKEIEHSSADYQTIDICSMACKIYKRILILHILVLKRAKEIENSSANNEMKGIVCLMDSKTFKRILTLLCSKKCKGN